MNEDLSNDPTPVADHDNVHVIMAGADRISLQVIVENDINLPELFRKAYHTNTVCSNIPAHPEAHLCFQVVNRLVWTKNQLNRDVVSVPREVFLRGRRIVEMIIDHAHKAIG
jgi:hypothetical protein